MTDAVAKVCEVCGGPADGCLVVNYYEEGHDPEGPDPGWSLVTDLAVCKDDRGDDKWATLAEAAGVLLALHCQCPVIVGATSPTHRQRKGAERYCKDNGLKLRIFDRISVHLVPFDHPEVAAVKRDEPVMKQIYEVGLARARGVKLK